MACNLGVKATQPAAPAGTLAPTSVYSSLVKGVVMSGGVNGDTQDPTDLKTVFTPQDVVHAVVQIQDAPAETKIKAAWYVVDVGTAADPNSEIDTSEVTTDGTRNIDFNLSPTHPWPAGSYRVDIYVNGEKVKESAYQIEVP
jgi:hypothetical protein